jgi:hypothetical protein
VRINKLLLALLTVSIFVAAACRKPASVPGAAARVRPVDVKIAVTSDASGNFTIKVDPDPVKIQRSKHEVLRFCVDFPSGGDSAVVRVDGFVAVGNPNRKNPFGTSEANNVFDIASYHFRNCFVQSQEPAPPAVAGATEHFKYNVTARIKDRVVQKLDPHVIISD